MMALSQMFCTAWTTLAVSAKDPDRARRLYDAGRTVAVPDAPRLGTIDVVLVSQLHGDHIGSHHIARVNDGECGKPESPVVAAPNTNGVNIALAKDAKIVYSR